MADSYPMHLFFFLTLRIWDSSTNLGHLGFALLYCYVFLKTPEPFFKHLALCYFLKRKSTGVVYCLLVLE